MATWSHFTSYLDGSRGIRKEERDELFDNFAALLAGTGCSSAGFSLDGTDTTAIKASSFITDMVSLDGPSISNQRQHLQSAAAAASAAFGNYAAAVSTALAGEGITSTDRDAILTARIDDHRLWNYYKRLIDALTCAAGISVVEYRARSASKTKCGHVEFGTPSSPPKRYLVKTLSGTQTQTQYVGPPSCTGPCTAAYEWVHTGNCTYDTACGAPTNTMKVTARESTSPGCIIDSFPIEYTWDCSAAGVFAPADEAMGGTQIETQTLIEAIMSGNCDPAGAATWGGSASMALSSEYSTALLETTVGSAASSASWSAWGTATHQAQRSTTSDEMTMTVQMFEFRVTFTSPMPAGMKLKWDLYLNGSFLTTNCVSLGTGVTTFGDTVTWPSGADGIYQVTNFRVEASC